MRPYSMPWALRKITQKGNVFDRFFQEPEKTQYAASLQAVYKKKMKFSWDKGHSIAESELSYTHVQK